MTPFNLTTSDGETLFCWHVLPLDVYLEHENELVQNTLGAVDDLRETLGYKLLKRDAKGRVVVNFHGVRIFHSLRTSLPTRSLFWLSPLFSLGICSTR